MESAGTNTATVVSLSLQALRASQQSTNIAVNLPVFLTPQLIFNTLRAERERASLKVPGFHGFVLKPVVWLPKQAVTLLDVELSLLVRVVVAALGLERRLHDMERGIEKCNRRPVRELVSQKSVGLKVAKGRRDVLLTSRHGRSSARSMDQ